MTGTMPRAGLDVHARQTHLASLDVRTGELVHQRIAGSLEALLDQSASPRRTRAMR